MQRFFLAALAATALAACSDTYDDRSRMAGSSSPPAAATQAPMSNVGQSPAVTSGSASNAASGSRATPAR